MRSSIADWSAETATDIAPALTTSDASVESFARACLARIAERDDEVRAWVHVDESLVLARARELDALPPPQRGPLHGLPIGVKDIVLTADQPTQYNSPLYRGFHPRIDAAFVQTLRAAGALIVGKTDTVEFGATGRGARTRNPWDLARTPGGSSSGSAAAVADRHVPVALGTQTGGSMMRPASYCGVWGFKPTWGLVSNEGVRRYAPSLDTLGWFARTCDDLRRVHDVFDTDPIEAVEPVDLSTSCVAVYRTSAWTRAEFATRDAMRRVIDALRDAGAQVRELCLPTPFKRLIDLHLLIMRSEGRASFLAESRSFPGLLEPSLLDQAMNTDGTTRAQLLEAYDVAAQCRHAFDAIAKKFDAILAPSAVGTAPLGLEGTGDYVFNGLWTLLHVPCVNVPGWISSDGLPVGLTVTGPRFSDRRTLAFADTLGALFAAGRRHPA